MEATVEELIQCICGKEMTVLFTSCGYVNCPACGTLLKVGACDA